jgi:glycosyltransferase involved in cell wall biosynthesis
MNLSTIILTLNEAIHIRRCIDSLRPLDGNVFVVDSFSTDHTVEMARELGAQVYQNAWPGLYSIQFNWALDNLPITTDWVLRLDADEYVCPELIDEIKAKLDALPEDVTGVEVNLRRVFMGRQIRRGMPRIKMLRLFRYGKARCEQRLMDEHMELLEGRSVVFDGEFADDNLNDMSWWTQKHVGYAIREAADLLDMEYGLLGEVRECESSKVQKSGNATNQTIENNGADSISASSKETSELPNSRTLELPHKLGGQAAAKRRMKMKYVRAPLFWRALVYFCMRYFVRGGFLEGKEGFMWHFFQGLWYRMLVDAKIWEIKRECGGDKKKMLEVLRGKYGLKI